MIYTVTFNPSLDYIVGIEKLNLGEVNRAVEEHILPGGKGINVSIVLTNLGIDNTALGFTAGFTGREITREIHGFGCKTDFIEIADGMSRINVKVHEKIETELNGLGPDITEEHVRKLFDKLNNLTEDDVLVLAGSIPNSMPDSIYADILKYVSDKKVKVVVDATKELLVNVLEYKPFLIKPNNHELGEIFGIKLTSKAEVLEYAKRLQQKGARNVLVSMAGDGAVFVSENGETYSSEAPKGKLINSVGAGDSMVAGFVAGYMEKREFEYAFKMGISAGSASAFSENLATKQEVLAIYNTL